MQKTLDLLVIGNRFDTAALAEDEIKPCGIRYLHNEYFRLTSLLSKNDNTALGQMSETHFQDSKRQYFQFLKEMVLTSDMIRGFVKAELKIAFELQLTIVNRLKTINNIQMAS